MLVYANRETWIEPALAPGAYRLEFSADGIVTETVDVDVTAGETKTIVVPLTAK